MLYQEDDLAAELAIKAIRCPHPAWIEIDLDQLRFNIRLLKAYSAPALLCLPIKANAYGHGLIQVGQVAEEEKVDYLAVAHLEEGALLREAGITLPILVLGAIHEDQIPLLIDYKLEITISSRLKANLVAQKCEELNKCCRIHLEVDTGMHRTGVRPSTAIDLFSYLKSKSCFEVVGVYSHLARAESDHDPIAQKQIQTFLTLIKSLDDDKVIYHLNSSNSCMFFQKANQGMIRPGLLAFGYPHREATYPLSQIKPCFALKAKVAYFKVVEASEGISYGHTYITSKKTRIVTIPVGYGDGYRRCLSNKAHVLIRGKKYPIAGTICMDQFMVDIGDDEVFVGDEVVLIGSQGLEAITIQEIAALSDSIPYEVLCLFNDRLPRIYLESKKPS